MLMAPFLGDMPVLLIGLDAQINDCGIEEKSQDLQEAEATVKSPDEPVKKIHESSPLPRGIAALIHGLGDSPQMSQVQTGLRMGSSSVIAPASGAVTERRPRAMSQ